MNECGLHFLASSIKIPRINIEKGFIFCEEGAGWLVRYHGVMSRIMDGVKIDRSRRGGKGDNDKERESTLTKTRAINCAKRLTDGLTD